MPESPRHPQHLPASGVWLERIACAFAVTEIHEDKSHKSGFPRECSEERKVPSLDTAWGEGLA